MVLVSPLCSPPRMFPPLVIKRIFSPSTSFWSFPRHWRLLRGFDSVVELPAVASVFVVASVEILVLSACGCQSSARVSASLVSFDSESNLHINVLFHPNVIGRLIGFSRMHILAQAQGRNQSRSQHIPRRFRQILYQIDSGATFFHGSRAAATAIQTRSSRLDRTRP